MANTVVLLTSSFTVALGVHAVREGREREAPRWIGVTIVLALAFLAPLGRKYGRKRVAAPLVMTPEYITGSLDAFPVEFLDFKLIHKTVYGEDLFTELVIDKPHLRLQCERELKTKLIGLRQGYISSLGKKELLTTVLVRSFTGSMALFRAILSLLDKEPPVARIEVIAMLASAARIDGIIF